MPISELIPNMWMEDIMSIDWGTGRWYQWLRHKIWKLCVRRSLWNDNRRVDANQLTNSLGARSNNCCYWLIMTGTNEFLGRWDEISRRLLCVGSKKKYLLQNNYVLPVGNKIRLINGGFWWWIAPPSIYGWEVGWDDIWRLFVDQPEL